MPTLTNDMTFILGGDAGQGMESTGAGFAKALARDGLQVFSGPDYHSRIRGGHNFYTVRASEKELTAHRAKAHLLLALTKDTVDLHLDDMESGAGVIYDPALGVDEAAIKSRGLVPMPLPAISLAEEAGSKLMANSALVGAAAAVVDWNPAAMEGVISESFGRKNAELAEANLKVARAGAEIARKQYRDGFGWRIHPVAGPKRLLLGGSQAVSLGAFAAGCRFVTGYPMTPTTPILEWWAAHAHEYGLVMKHAEDEIAAINMAIGANQMGVRSMTATSGGGFSLMVEGLGLAGMVEVPLVVTEGMRAGPSTAMATRTEQGDLLFLLHASQGEFLRIVLTPGTVSQCFEATWRAFNLAEKYQTPVLVVIDQFIAHFQRTLEPDRLGTDKVTIDRGRLLTTADLDALQTPYQRYAITDDGISPRALPGHPKSVYAATSDEHDADSHINEESAVRVQMHRKRLAKIAGARAEMRGPTVYGSPDAPLALVCWGSTFGPAREAVDDLAAGGKKVRLVHFCDIWPFPGEAAVAALKGATRVLTVEGNSTGQLGWLLRAETGIKADGLISRSDGRPFVVEDILAAL